LAECRRYAIITAYIAEGAPWTRTLRVLAEAGASIVSKDEVSRRLVARAPAPALGRVLEALAEAADTVAVEVKAYCPGLRLEPRTLAREGFLVTGPRGRPVAYGVVRGRLVMVEAVGRGVAVKLGARRRSRRVTSVPGAGEFVFAPAEARGALDELEKAIGDLVVMLWRNRQSSS